MKQLATVVLGLAMLGPIMTAPVVAQTTVSPDAPAGMSESAPSEMEVGNGELPAAAETPEARLRRECGEWAQQDGVPADELETYINDCVEDRNAAQE